jgi:zinc/manganese transport system substrate-binding protein/manganese/iron transport system substrate-binding protein
MQRLVHSFLLFLVLTIGMPMAAMPAAAQEEKVQIATSMPILADIVQNVAGDRAEVFSIMPENADPHTWEASPQDFVRVSAADSFISLGAHLEPFVENGGWRRAVIDAGIPELVLTDHVELIVVDRVIDHGDHVHDLTGGDPHIWLDPTKVIEAMPAIVEHLAEIDPGGAETYAGNAAAYVSELEALDAELEASFAAIPNERRVLVVFHDAYTYFAARYGFEVVGVVIRNPQADISAGEVVELLRVIEEYDVPVIFAEPQFTPSVLDSITAEADVEIGMLLSDSFGDEVDSYLEMMRYNRDSIVRYLGES